MVASRHVLSETDFCQKPRESGPREIRDNCFDLYLCNLVVSLFRRRFECGSDKDENYDIYTITAEPLPSHMRSLIPAPTRQIEAVVTEVKMTNRHRLRYILLTVLVFIISLVLLSVSLYIGFHQSPKPTQIQHLSEENPKINHTLITDITVHSSLQHSPKTQEVYPSYITRTPCINECWAYAAFRFKSQCVKGLCQCQGSYYDPLTCLPHVEDCNIIANSPSVAKASLHGRAQKTFTCQTSRKKESDVYVLSIFGNHRSLATNVKINGDTAKPKVLVLVNYHPINWQIQMNSSVHIEKLVLVSFNHLSRTNVYFTNAETKPSIKRLFSLTGYGQDRFGGHTPELLKNLVHEFGSISSFTGTSHADNWELNFNDDDSTPSEET
ncbi:hypothetical protein LOTGIDRAFT_236472 [Lottia gigantea]|uniref:Uncharacterized protein n=1 Tax=Lottia gigantea TaxID=225164 RepID=V3YZI7_LOTGI|nr:hypothetical protein LOTGIDRAFT_236472 [Lottia gigantea]ESO83613.1 hypothetical protein LOTGIDRAFT_236472 [Lottia gigantea]